MLRCWVFSLLPLDGTQGDQRSVPRTSGTTITTPAPDLHFVVEALEADAAPRLLPVRVVAMRVWMVTQWFDPEPTFKGLLFAKELQRRGHEVEVVTGFPNYPGGKVYDGYRIRPYQREVVDGIVVHRVALYPRHDSSGPQAGAQLRGFASAAAVTVLAGRRPDVAYVYHPPGTVGAARGRRSAAPRSALRLRRPGPLARHPRGHRHAPAGRACSASSAG